MWHDPVCLEPTKRLAQQFGVAREQAEKINQRMMMSSIADAASKLSKPGPQIEAPSDECYSKAALWTD